MTEPYSLRTLVAPDLRKETACVFSFMGVAAAVAGYATVVGMWHVFALEIVALIGGLVALSRIDERARELESEA